MSQPGKSGYVLDRFIGWFSPSRGVGRMNSRMAMEAVIEEKRNYDAARMDRYGSNWVPLNRRPDETDRMYRGRIRARARDLERNNEIAGSVLLALERHVVGTGICPQAKILNSNGTENEDLNRQLEALWKIWSRGKHCDITGHQSIYGLQRMILRRMIVDGEIFPILTAEDDGFIPLKLQILEADGLAEWLPSQNNSGRIVSGVEVNPYWKPIAYWFYKEELESSSNMAQMIEAVSISADRVLPFFTKTRPQAVRGMSHFANVMGRIRDSGEYMDAELMAARVAACFAAFVKPGGNLSVPVGRNTMVSDERGQKKMTTRLEPGSINTLPDGAGIEFANPTHPNSGAGEFVALQQRLIGAGTGQSYEVVSRDVSKTNYSSARAAFQEDEEGYKVIRQNLVDWVLVPLWETFVESCVLSGKVKIRDFFQKKEEYCRCRWVPPGRPWVDPLKEVVATTKELDAGIRTLQDVCAAKGTDWREIIEQRSREVEYLNSLGLGEDDNGKTKK